MDIIEDDQSLMFHDKQIWINQFDQNCQQSFQFQPTDLPNIGDDNQQNQDCLKLDDFKLVNRFSSKQMPWMWDYSQPEMSPLIKEKNNGYQNKLDVKRQSSLQQLMQEQLKSTNYEQSLRNSSSIKQTNELTQKLAKEFLESKNITKGWKKNTNLPKFLVRVYLKYYEQFNNDHSQATMLFFKKVRKQMKSKGCNAYKISDVLKLFDNPRKPNAEMAKNNREVMCRILRETSQQEIIESNYIHTNLKGYLMRSKVYALRCRSKLLAERIKLH